MSKNILIIDDDFSLRRVIEKALKNSKTNIKSVSTISEAWVDIEKNEFDLIICDVVLPDGDGLELVKKVKLKNNSQSFDKLKNSLTQKQDKSDYFKTLSSIYKKSCESWYNSYFGTNIYEKTNKNLDFINNVGDNNA